MNPVETCEILGDRNLKKQVYSNKDGSEGRDEEKIAERYLPDLIADCFLQIFCRYIAGCL